MKKIILLVFILVIADIIIVFRDSILIDEVKVSKDELWERIKVQVFLRANKNNSPVFRYKGPILFALNNATTKDSLAFYEILIELKTLLSSEEVNYFNDYTGHKMSAVEIMSANEFIVSNSGKPRHEIEKKPLINGYSLSYLNIHTIRLNFIEEHVDEKKKLMKKNISVDDRNAFGHFNELSDSPQTKVIAGYLNPQIYFRFYTNNSFEERRRVLENVIFKILSCDSFYISDDYINSVINKSDKLVLQKFYSPDFNKEFKSYMYKVYGWRHTTSIINNDLARLNAILIIGVIGLIFFILIFGLFQNKLFKYSYLNYFLPIFCVWLCFLNSIFIYRYLTEVNIVVYWYEIVVFGLVVVPVLSLTSAFILWFLDFFLIKGNNNLSLKLILKTVYTFLAFIAPVTALFFFDGHKREGVNFFFLSFMFFITLAIGLLIYLNHFSEFLVKEKDVELSHLKEVNAQSELKLLQSHINPHVLYNALNSIAGLAHDDADKTEKMALSLSDLFRYSINKKEEKMSSVNEEVTMVQNYLDIEKIRFGERLIFSLSVEELMKEEKIPMFMLQPLIENAIKHGVSKIGGEAKVGLEIKKDKSNILITVSDNGPDFPKGLVSGHGLQTVYDLLRLSYGDKASLFWENTPEKSIKITIKKD